MLQINDCVKLKKEQAALAAAGITIGAVVDNLSGTDIYTVEFVDTEGETILLADFSENELEKA